MIHPLSQPIVEHAEVSPSPLPGILVSVPDRALALLQYPQRQPLPILSLTVQAPRKLRIVGGFDGGQRPASTLFRVDDDDNLTWTLMSVPAGDEGEFATCGCPPMHQAEAPPFVGSHRHEAPRSFYNLFHYNSGKHPLLRAISV